MTDYLLLHFESILIQSWKIQQSNDFNSRIIRGYIRINNCETKLILSWRIVN